MHTLARLVGIGYNTRMKFAPSIIGFLSGVYAGVRRPLVVDAQDHLISGRPASWVGVDGVHRFQGFVVGLIYRVVDMKYLDTERYSPPAYDGFEAGIQFYRRVVR